MNLLICIASYGRANLKFLEKELEEFSEWKKYNLDIIIDTTVELDFKKYEEKLNISYCMYDDSIKMDLAFQHRKHMKDNIDKYDLYMYVENDTLVTEKNVDTWLKLSKDVPKDYVIGFSRYELKPNDERKHLVPLNIPWLYPVKKKDIIINNKKYFEVYNPHQAVWILTNEQLHKAINSGNVTTESYTLKCPKISLGRLEVAASEVF